MKIPNTQQKKNLKGIGRGLPKQNSEMDKVHLLKVLFNGTLKVNHIWMSCLKTNDRNNQILKIKVISYVTYDQEMTNTEAEVLHSQSVIRQNSLQMNAEARETIDSGSRQSTTIIHCDPIVYHRAYNNVYTNTVSEE